MSGWLYTEAEAEKVNDLAREQFKARMLADICFDLNVCSIEGYDPREYIDDLISELARIRSKL